MASAANSANVSSSMASGWSSGIVAVGFFDIYKNIRVNVWFSEDSYVYCVVRCLDHHMTRTLIRNLF